MKKMTFKYFVSRIIMGIINQGVFQVVFISFILLIMSCSKDKSNNAELTDFKVNSISNKDISFVKTKLDKELAHVCLYFENNLFEETFPIKLKVSPIISSKAKVLLDSPSELVFENPNQVVSFDIEAENGDMKTWYVFLIHKQLQNSNFSMWFNNQGLNGRYYKEIGSSFVESVWSTANMGTSTYSSYGTQPITDGSNTMVQLRTDSVRVLPITAATLFTGVFNLSGAISNPTNPQAAVLFGTPFIYSPVSFKVKYKYTSGRWLKKAKLRDVNNIFGGFTENGIEGEDQCAIYAILENRDKSPVVEVARAELFSASTANNLTEEIVEFSYVSEIKPTHVTVVFSSSRYGDFWQGAVNSTLIVDYFKFIYE